jgi:ElaB/YqjD/DUF883 family membrane-anchored ribosome-binding protein
MNIANENSFETKDAGIVDSIAGKSHDGIQSLKNTANEAGRNLSTKVNEMRSQASDVADQADGVIRKSLNTAKAAVQRVGESTESLVAYTKENPVKSLLIAAVSGALLASLITAFSRNRDRA